MMTKYFIYIPTYIILWGCGAVDSVSTSNFSIKRLARLKSQTVVGVVAKLKKGGIQYKAKEISYIPWF